jgi:hypothetical protein
MAVPVLLPSLLAHWQLSVMVSSQGRSSFASATPAEWQQQQQRFKAGRRQCRHRGAAGWPQQHLQGEVDTNKAAERRSFTRSSA